MCMRNPISYGRAAYMEYLECPSKYAQFDARYMGLLCQEYPWRKGLGGNKGSSLRRQLPPKRRVWSHFQARAQFANYGHRRPHNLAAVQNSSVQWISIRRSAH